MPAVDHWKAHGLDLSAVLHVPDLPAGAARRRIRDQDHRLDKALDNELLRIAAPAIERGAPVRATVAVRNEHRSVGAMLGGEVARRYGGVGLPGRHDRARRSSAPAGQSFGAFLPRGVTLRLFGDANDYVGKGLSGGRLVIRPHETAPFAGGGADHRRQHHPLRSDRPASCSCAAGSASASRCATPAPPRSSRAWATTAAST